jgi:hypothetical protein
MEMRKTTREVATAASSPAEVMASSFVTPDKPLPTPRSLEHMQVLLTPRTVGAVVADVPAGPYQQVERTAEGVRVTVRRAHARREVGYVLPYREEAYAPLLEANKWLEVGDPLLKEMARKAVGDATNAVDAALRIESFVRDEISDKNLGIGMATAAETARQMAGDCTEHAMLVAGLARVAGMPSRVVGGLAYVDRLPGTDLGGFGYHMWAEAYVGEWLPLDAALGSHDATHLAIVRSDLNDDGGALGLSAAIVQFLGKIKIQVLATTAPCECEVHAPRFDSAD